MDILGLTASTYSRANPVAAANRITLNIIQSCVDTAAAKISSKRPKPMFLTEGGDWKLQRKAKKLDKFVEGLFYGAKTYETTHLTFLDAGVFGTGITKVYAENGRIINERIFPDELKVDDADAMYGKPRTLYQTKAIDREVLLGGWPKARQAIEEAQRANTDDGPLVNVYADQVMVTEAWHLPIVTFIDEKMEVIAPGRHVICIENADLLDEPWERDHFPFAKFVFNPRLYGWFGQGAAEVLTGKQIAINKTLKNIALAHHLGSAPIWMKEKGSKVIDAHLNNAIGNILEYQGMPPELKVFQTVAPEIYNHLKWLIQSSFEEIGISQLSAQSRKPAGLDSGKALREYNDIESERFMCVGQRWEQYHMDIAHLMIEAGRELYGENPNFSVKGIDKSFVRTIKWADVDMPRDQYVMKVWPVSAFSATPSAKMQEVTEGVQAGLIPPEAGQRLLDFPDLERYYGLKFARQMVVERLVENLIEEGEFTPPEPFMDLAYAKDYATNAYSQAKLDNAPETHLELLRRFIEQAQSMLDTAVTPEAPQQAPQLDAAPMPPGGDMPQGPMLPTAA